MRISSLVKAALVTVLLVHPSTSGAQGVTPADAKAFLGTWTIDIDTPGGPITVDLTLTDTAGARITGRIADLSGSSLSLDVNGATRDLAERDVTRTLMLRPSQPGPGFRHQ